MKTFYLNSIDAIHRAATYILTIKPEDKKKVTVSEQGSKLARMKGLDRFWDEDIANAGIGGIYESTAYDVHIYGKLLFVLPIQIAADPAKADHYQGVINRLGNSLEARFMYAATHVHTSDLSTKDHWKYMQEKKNHYLPLGVNLTDPALQGLAL